MQARIYNFVLLKMRKGVPGTWLRFDLHSMYVRNDWLRNFSEVIGRSTEPTRLDPQAAICAVLAPSQTSAVFRSIALGSDASAPPLSAPRRGGRHEHEIDRYKIQLEIVYLMLAQITATLRYCQYWYCQYWYWYWWYCQYPRKFEAMWSTRRAPAMGTVCIIGCGSNMHNQETRALI